MTRRTWWLPALLLTLCVAGCGETAGQELDGAASMTSPSPAPSVSIAPSPSPSVVFARAVIGESVEGRPIRALSFGTGERVSMLIVGGVHGNEFGIDVAEELARRLRADPKLVPEGARIDIIPCLNPDGRAHDTRGNANDVDLNRNMPTENWQSELSAEDQARSMFGLNGGSGPASEPESGVFIDYLENDFDVVLSLHSQGGILDPTGPGGLRLARQMARVCGFPVSKVGYDSAITGSMGQWVPAEYDIPIITVELVKPRLTKRLMEALLLPAQGD